jgi:hypothetical protein
MQVPDYEAVTLWPGGACEWSPPIADEEERTLLRSAKEAGLSVEDVRLSSLRPHSHQSTTTMDPGASWQLSKVWSWDKVAPGDIGPLAVVLPVGLYGEVTACFSPFSLTATARRIHGSFLDVHVDYLSGRETLFRGSLRRSSNVCSRPFRWCSTTHTFKLCGRHPIHGRDARICSNEHRRSWSSLAAHTL